MKIQLDLAEIFRIKKCLFVCLFIDLFFILIILGCPHEYTLQISWWSDLIWLIYLGFIFLFFVGLFVCLFIDLFGFCFSHSGTPTESSSENFVNIRLDLADILRIRKLDLEMFICLFVCLFVHRFVFFLIILGHPQKVPLKILWRSDFIWLRY